MHQIIRDLVTEDNVESLGFVSWSDAEGLMQIAFDGSNSPSAFRSVLEIAQFVVLSRRFRVASARPPSC